MVPIFQELVVVETYTKKEKPSEVFTTLLKDRGPRERDEAVQQVGGLFGWWMVDGIMTILGHTVREKNDYFVGTWNDDVSRPTWIQMIEPAWPTKVKTAASNWVPCW